MSGLEVVGVVLGAIPIIVLAVEHYGKIGKKYEAFRRKRHYIDDLVDSLNDQQTLIEGEVKVLLRGSQVDKRTMDQYVRAGRLSALLSQPEVQCDVKDFLDDDYDIFVRIFEKYEKLLLELTTSLKRYHDSSWIEYGSLAGMIQDHDKYIPNGVGTRFWKKVKFSIHKDDLERVVKDIRRHSKDLNRLTQRRQMELFMQAQPSDQKTRKFVAMLQRIRHHVACLYAALSKGVLPSCRDQHEARLYLDSRIDHEDAVREWPLPLLRHKMKDITFGMSLRKCSNSSFQACVVEVLDSNDEEYSSSLPAADSTPGSAVSFILPSSTPSGSGARLPVDDICLMLNTTPSAEESLRLFLSSSSPKLHYTFVAPDLRHNRWHSCLPYHNTDGNNTNNSGANVVKLQEILANPRYRSALKPKLRLAATIASSVLQLHGTPWHPPLRCSSFLLRRNPGGDLDWDTPIVARGLSSISPSSPSHPPSKSASPTALDLLDLGILILELYHHVPLSVFASSAGLPLHDVGDRDARARVAAAWADVAADTMVNQVEDAVAACLGGRECRFGGKRLGGRRVMGGKEGSLEDWDICARVLERVVRPLWESCRRRGGEGLVQDL